MSKKKISNSKNIKYIEAIIYILLIIVVIFASVYGSIYIKMLPLLLILGIVGKVIFDRSATTTVFGIVVSLCIIYTKGQVGILENIILSMCTGLNIALGELFGKFLIITFNVIKRRKKANNIDVFKTYILCIMFTIITIGVHIYIYGDVFQYEKCKKSLYKYLDETYSKNEKFEIIDVKYNFLTSRNFVFNLRNIGHDDINKFVIHLKDVKIVNDGYKNILLVKDNNKLSLEFYSFLNSHKINNEYTINLKYLEFEKIELSIIKNINDLSDNSVIDFSKDVANIINQISEFEKYSQIVEIKLVLDINNPKDIIVSNIIMSKYSECLYENRPQYIENSLDIEFIDSSIRRIK